ncbi:bacteriocin [Staphylococcus auricularis]|uniref:Bacteriocin n=1 Tax=Staphylococcus auricularis TaxID=29379 RepID=A0ABX5IGH3_9STAP|nr:bacteriocin [Staphylococcus auricularis]MCE5038950.1 bacteriocin [Staphylococcus auricularis]MEB6570752.1 bacteriocin [Staphylococcus auricularis]PTH18524.1 hypothetical protein BU607_04645 [Staphylococcus auricularis]PTH25473.1 hypothetical protein BU608_07445 [Staphylococcus auricularis]
MKQLTMKELQQVNGGFWKEAFQRSTSHIQPGLRDFARGIQHFR